MAYSKEMQDKIDAKAAAQRTTGPSFPMPRLNHNGGTGEWMIREIVNGKLADVVSVFNREGMVEADIQEEGKKPRKGMVGGKWRGVILRHTNMCETKWKEGAVSKKFTREFTNFKTEPIEVMRTVFGPAGQTTSLKMYLNYQDFKEKNLLRDEEGNEAGSSFALKSVLYVYLFERKEVVKVLCGGSARSEWWEYLRFKPSGDERVKTIPFMVTEPSAKLVEQVMTEFVSTATVNPKGMPYHRLTFKSAGLLTEAELSEAWEVQERINEWVKAWAAITAHKNAEKEVMAASPASPSTASPMPKSAASAIAAQAVEEDEINLDDIPF